jgi:hypothetical protein
MYLRARETITSYFRIPSSGHLGPIFIRNILNVGLAMLAVLFPQIRPICHKSGYEFWEIIVSRALSVSFDMMGRRMNCVLFAGA